jgi:ribose transport system permease protein
MSKASGALPLSERWPVLRNIQSSRGTLIAAAILIAIFVLLRFLLPKPMAYRDIRFLLSSVGTLSLAAMGATIVIISKGFDLSVGSIISFVNVLVAFNIQDTPASQCLWALAALLIGGAIGAFNGFFVSYLRVQPVVVTLATMFIVQGATTLYAPSPGGRIPPAFMHVFNGDLAPGTIPWALVLLGAVLLLWTIVRSSRFGTNIYAVGSDETAAFANGVPVKRVKMIVYALAGVFYGAAGLFLSGQMGNGQPLEGNRMILLIFAAVVLGGSALGGGRGSCLGSVFGAGILILISNLLLILRIPLSFSPITEGLILILAIAVNSVTDRSSPARLLHFSVGKWFSRQPGPLTSRGEKPPSPPADKKISLRANDELVGSWFKKWRIRNRETIKFVVPVYLLLIAILLVTLVIYGHGIFSTKYLNSVLVLTVFLAVVGLGQGSVIISGGFDLSVPRVITFCGVLLTGLSNGSDQALFWVIPLILAAGAALGAINGLGITAVGLPPVIMTLAMNSIVYGLILIYTRGGSMFGAVPPALINFIVGKALGFSPVALFTILWVVFATLLLSRTGFARRLFAVGNSQVVARLSGVKVARTIVLVYMLSGVCSALAAILLAAFTQQAPLNLGNPYLLPAIAVVLTGGTLATGGRGHYLGIFGGVALFTALSTMVSGTTVPISLRDVILGFVILAAVLLTRERSY